MSGENQKPVGILMCACGHSEFIHGKDQRCGRFGCDCEGYRRPETVKKDDTPQILALVEKIRQGSGEAGNSRFLKAKDLVRRYGSSAQFPYHHKGLRALRLQFGRKVLWKLSEIEAYEAYSRDAVAGSDPDLIYMKENVIYRINRKLKMGMN